MVCFINNVKEKVPRMRFELIHSLEHSPLKAACLPISPPGLLKKKPEYIGF